MSDTTYQFRQTVIGSPWLQDMNDAIYRVFGQNGAVPVNTSLAQSLQIGLTLHSVAALRASVRTKTTPYVNTAGYATPGDGGHGVYWYNAADSSSADNGITIIVGADGARWYLLHSGTLNILQAGGKGDGITNNNTAMQAAHGLGLVVYYPTGTYIFNTRITLTAGGIIGDGPISSILQSTDTSANDLFTWNGAGGSPLDTTKTPPYLRDFRLIAPVNVKTGGTSFNLVPTAGEISLFQAQNVHFLGGYIQIGGTAYSHAKILGSTFLNYSQAGVLVQNQNIVDSGDSTIADCTFNCDFTSATAQAAVLHYSSGGLRLENSKILGGNYGYLMQAQLGASNCADVLIQGNSIEDTINSSVQFNRASGTGSVSNVMILDNEVGGGANNIVMNDPSGFLTLIAIQGNNCNQIGNGSAGVVFDYNANAYIANNQFYGGAGSVGISAGLHYTNLHIGINQYGVATPYGAGVPSQTVVDLTQQSGSGVATTTSAYGSFFIGSTTITFPKAFSLAPTKYGATLSTTGSGAIATIVTAVSTTQMTVSGVALSNSAAVAFEWFADGVA